MSGNPLAVSPSQREPHVASGAGTPAFRDPKVYRFNPFAYNYAAGTGALQVLKMIFVGFTLFPIRVVVLGVSLGTAWLVCLFASCCISEPVDEDGRPMPVDRPRIRRIVSWSARGILWAFGYWRISRRDMRPEMADQLSPRRHRTSVVMSPRNGPPSAFDNRTPPASPRSPMGELESAVQSPAIEVVSVTDEVAVMGLSGMRKVYQDSEVDMRAVESSFRAVPADHTVIEAESPGRRKSSRHSSTKRTPLSVVPPPAIVLRTPDNEALDPELMQSNPTNQLSAATSGNRLTNGTPCSSGRNSAVLSPSPLFGSAARLQHVASAVAECPDTAAEVSPLECTHRQTSGNFGRLERSLLGQGLECGPTVSDFASTAKHSTVLHQTCSMTMAGQDHAAADAAAKATPSKRAPVIVCNHLSFIDMLYMGCAFDAPLTVGAKETMESGLMRPFTRVLQFMSVQRDDPQSCRDAAQEILRRTKWRYEQPADVLEEHGLWPPLLVYPEGTITNGECLLEFKGGAFLGGVPVQPVVVRCPFRHCDPHWIGPVSVKSIGLRLMLQVYNTLEATHLPPFIPDEEEELHPNLFASRVRTAMATAGNIDLCERNYSDVKLDNHCNALGFPHCVLDTVSIRWVRAETGLDHDDALDAAMAAFVELAQRRVAALGPAAGDLKTNAPPKRTRKVSQVIKPARPFKEDGEGTASSSDLDEEYLPQPAKPTLVLPVDPALLASAPSPSRWELNTAEGRAAVASESRRFVSVFVHAATVVTNAE